MEGIDWHNAANYAALLLVVMATIGMGIAVVLVASGWGP